MSLWFRVASFHGAPPRALIARAVGLARLARVRAKFKGGDFNVVARMAVSILGRLVAGGGVLWLTVPRRGWRVIDHESIDVGSDHPAELITMRHRRSGRVVTFLVVNCMSVSTGKLQAEQIMRVAIELGADVIIASECRKFRAWHVDVGRLYAWNQPGEPGSSESGALIGALRSTCVMTERRRVVGSRATREGGGIDERSITRSRITMRPKTQPPVFPRTRDTSSR